MSRIVQWIYPDQYKHLMEISKKEFKGLLDVFAFIDEVNNISHIHFGLRAGKLFEKMAYCDIDDFSNENIDVICTMVKEKQKQRESRG